MKSTRQKELAHRFLACGSTVIFPLRLKLMNHPDEMARCHPCSVRLPKSAAVTIAITVAVTIARVP
jgi:hypothetical protein